MHKKSRQLKNFIIFFDAACLLCSRAVHFLLKKDKKSRFHYASLDSSLARELRLSDEDSLVVMENGIKFTGAQAIVRIGLALPYPWKILSWLSLLPKRWSGYLYKQVAQRRYRWFGKAKVCFRFSKNEERRFLS